MSQRRVGSKCTFWLFVSSRSLLAFILPRSRGGGSGEKEGVLVAHSINRQGKRAVLHLSLGGGRTFETSATSLHSDHICDNITRGLLCGVEKEVNHGQTKERVHLQCYW